MSSFQFGLLSIWSAFSLLVPEKEKEARATPYVLLYVGPLNKLTVVAVKPAGSSHVKLTFWPGRKTALPSLPVGVAGTRA